MYLNAESVTRVSDVHVCLQACSQQAVAHWYRNETIDDGKIAFTHKVRYLDIFRRLLITTSPIDRVTGYCFRLISLFHRLYVSFFVSKITRKRLDWFAWNFQGRCGVTMGWPDYIFGQFWETARCCDAQHGDGVCCALAPQLVLYCLSCDVNALRSVTFGVHGRSA